ncbi:branchpoint-bridging protein-like [Notothenia coriiceps]|uniref:Branchpoint-bridging protein-like n=1 Tax=Notothenia coriiceps TaxID=8208 RepID=A0A6I9P806_9TELE|nr:PREDICTED: branchpoint-bridging protein-like [Notothenia coriiceps]
MKELSWDGSGAQDWQQANSPMTVCAPPASTLAASQAFTYHNTDSAEVTSAWPHCALSDQPSAEQGAWSYSGATTMGVQMQEDHFSPQGQQSTPQSSEAYEQNSEPPKQAGWFSGWFKSKPKDVPEERTEQRSTAQTDFPPTFGFCPSPPPAIPPPAIAPPAMFPSQPSSAGINPFSRKAVYSNYSGGP